MGDHAAAIADVDLHSHFFFCRQDPDQWRALRYLRVCRLVTLDIFFHRTDLGDEFAGKSHQPYYKGLFSARDPAVDLCYCGVLRFPDRYIDVGNHDDLLPSAAHGESAIRGTDHSGDDDIRDGDGADSFRGPGSFSRCGRWPAATCADLDVCYTGSLSIEHCR